MIRTKTIVKTFFLLSVLLLYYNCTTSDKGEGGQHASVGERIKKHNDTIAYTVSTSEMLGQLKTVMASIHDTVTFLIPERTSQIKSFPCSNCHSKSVEELSLGRKANERKSHWDIKMVHGSTDVMNCFTCHGKSNLNELVSLTGKPITFDQSFNLCGQCHSTQFKDWVGGAHGKRLGGWAPPKIKSTCTNCHNPHKPAFETRWPARLNTADPSTTNPEK